MAEESVAASETPATDGKVSYSIDEAAARLREIRENPQPEAPVEVAAEEAVTPEPVEAEPVKETVEAEEADFEPDWSELADTSDDIETTEGSDGTADFLLKYRGDERRVTREEATRYAQMGLDYDVQMSALGKERKEFEAFQANAKESYDREIAEARQSREALAERLAKFTKDLKPPSLELAESDIDEYQIQKARYDASVMEADAVAADLDRQNKEEQQKRESRVNAALEAHMQRLNTRVPATKDQKTMDNVGKYMVEGMGFTRDDLVVNQRIHPADSRLLEMAFKAMKYDAARLKAKKMRAQPGKPTRPGQAGRVSGPRDSVKDAIAKAKKSGSKNDAVEALIAMNRSKAS